MNENFPFNTDIENHIKFIKDELDEITLENFWKMRNSIVFNVYMDNLADIKENMKIIKNRIKSVG